MTELPQKLLLEFQQTQKRKKRKNILSAYRKMRAGKELNKLEREALNEFFMFIKIKVLNCSENEEVK